MPKDLLRCNTGTGRLAHTAECARRAGTSESRLTLNEIGRAVRRRSSSVVIYSTWCGAWCAPFGARQLFFRAGSTRRNSYLQGRASSWQSTFPADPEQLIRLLAAREKRAQSVPYSNAVKLAQELIAAFWAAALVRPLPLP